MMKRVDLRMYSLVAAEHRRCKTGAVGGAGECMACPAEQGEVCQLHRVPCAVGMCRRNDGVVCPDDVCDREIGIID